MKHLATPTAIAITVISLLLFGCGSDLERPDQALIVTGAEELAGATVSLDGVFLGSLELLEKPPKLVLWAISRLTGNEVPGDDGHETVALVIDLEGTFAGAHLVVVEHPAYQPIEKSFNYPDDLVTKPDQPDSGVVFRACTPHDLVVALESE